MKRCHTSGSRYTMSGKEDNSLQTRGDRQLLNFAFGSLLFAFCIFLCTIYKRYETDPYLLLHSAKSHWS